MTPSTVARLALCAAVAALTAASCGGNRPDFLACNPGSFELQGTVDGTAVAIAEPAGGGFSQAGGGTFDYGNDPGAAPNSSQVTLVWGTAIPDGASTTATAMFVMGSGPFAGQSFCAGAGTVVEIEPSGEIRFDLAGLTSGDGCASPRAGLLRGCDTITN